MQTRAVTGIQFENNTLEGYRKVNISPRIMWEGIGRNNFDKIKSLNYDVTKFIIIWEKSRFTKADWEGPNGELYEVKKYSRKDIDKWKLFSEPFFKMASKGRLKCMRVEEYNKFVDEFYEYNKSNGTFDKIIKNICNSVSGIYIENHECIPMEDLEFKIEILRNCWEGYNRITLFFRLKPSKQ